MNIRDGTQWQVTICTIDAEECTRYAGSNVYPPNLGTLRQHLRSLYKELGGQGEIPF